MKANNNYFEYLKQKKEQEKLEFKLIKQRAIETSR